MKYSQKLFIKINLIVKKKSMKISQKFFIKKYYKIIFYFIISFKRGIKILYDFYKLFLKIVTKKKM